MFIWIKFQIINVTNVINMTCEFWNDAKYYINGWFYVFSK